MIMMTCLWGSTQATCAAPAQKHGSKGSCILIENKQLKFKKTAGDVIKKAGDKIRMKYHDVEENWKIQQITGTGTTGKVKFINTKDTKGCELGQDDISKYTGAALYYGAHITAGDDLYDYNNYGAYDGDYAYDSDYAYGGEYVYDGDYAYDDDFLDFLYEEAWDNLQAAKEQFAMAQQLMAKGQSAAMKKKAAIQKKKAAKKVPPKKKTVPKKMTPPKKKTVSKKGKK